MYYIPPLQYISKIFTCASKVTLPKIKQGFVKVTFPSPFQYLKPIFHYDAKPFALGTFASTNAKDSTFALPNAKNTNMLVSLALGDASFLRWLCTFLFFCVDFIRFGYPTRTPFPVEYRWR